MKRLREEKYQHTVIRPEAIMAKDVDDLTDKLEAILREWNADGVTDDSPFHQIQNALRRYRQA